MMGGSDGSTALDSAEVYDPSTETWSPTTPMSTARVHPTATVLVGGRVLVAGGATDGSNILELYNPTTGTWTHAGQMETGREGHTATLQPDGKVLLAGGRGP